MITGSISKRPADVGCCGTRIRRLLLVSATVGITAVSLMSAGPASAQTTFQCSGGPNEEQVGVTMQGPVTVPLCVSRAAASRADVPRGERSDRARYYTGDGMVSLPPGWRQSYGLFRNVAIGTHPETGGVVYDYIISMGHPSPEHARDGLRAECLARSDLLRPETDCTGDGTLIRLPFVSVVYYPDDPYWGSRRGQYEVYSGSRPGPQGASPDGSGGLDYCFQSGLAPDRCGQPHRHLLNGEIATADTGRRR